MALTTAAAVRAAQRQEPIPDDADTTALLESLIAAVDSWIARYCGYPPATPGAVPTVEDTTYTRYSDDGMVVVDHENARLLRLRLWPVLEVTTIHEDLEEEFGGDTLVADTDYLQRGKHGHHVKLKRSSLHGRWSSTPGAVQVVFRAGYPSDGLDPALSQAATELVLHLYNKDGKRGVSGVKTGDLNLTFTTKDVPKDIRRMVSSFRLPGLFF